MNSLNSIGRLSLAGAALALAAVFGSSCGDSGGNAASGDAAGGSLKGEIRIDGSSTVQPVSSAVAETFREVQPGINVTVAESGTSGGFKKWLKGEIDISNASRVIDEVEDAKAREIGMEYVELPIAFDGLTVVVNPKNDWATSLTVDELRRIWEPNSKVKRWSDVRPGFPNRTIKLFGAGPESGTFDYFTETIVGEKRASRKDYTPSEDDNVLVVGVAGEADSLGYFGYSYFENNRDKLAAVAIDAGSGPVSPSPETITDGTYQPLSRPLFLYVSAKALERPEIMAFLEFYLDQAKTLVKQVGYVPLPDEVYALVKERLRAKVTGSAFLGKKTTGVKLADLLAAEKG
jgi:phosphate transport system substrate-binding protein